MNESKLDYDRVFARELIEGLSQNPKRLSSKYFYDREGDRMFQKIMQLPEYYLTKAEYEIFSLQKEKIFSFLKQSEKFQIVEFGAGDGLKTKILLDYLMKQKVNFEYLPIDISASVLKTLEKDLKQKHPTMVVKPMSMSYFDALKKLSVKHRKVLLFLGGNIGNFIYSDAKKFLKSLRANLEEDDQLLMGMDLKKHPKTILSAYNDSRGVTKAFNLNLLRRINREFDGDFELSDFDHYPTYDPISGETKSFLISLKEQNVRLNALNKDFHFHYAEPIFTEISKKYDLEEINRLAKESGFMVQKNFFDCKSYFVDSLWKASNEDL